MSKKKSNNQEIVQNESLDEKEKAALSTEEEAVSAQEESAVEPVETPVSAPEEKVEEVPETPAVEEVEESKEEATLPAESEEEPQEEIQEVAAPGEEKGEESESEETAQEDSTGDANPEETLAEEENKQPAEGEAQMTEEEKAEQERKIREEAELAAEKARKKAEKKAQNKIKRKENNAKFLAWVKRHKIFVTIFLIVFALVLGTGIATLVITRNMYFIYNAQGIDKMIEKGKRKDMKLEKDVTYEGDLTLNGYTIDLNNHTLTVNGNLTLTNEDEAVLGTQKWFWADYGKGGSVVVNGNLILEGKDYTVYSTLTANEVQINKGNVTLENTVTGKEGALLLYAPEGGGSLYVNAAVEGNVELAANAELYVNGSVEKVSGGAIVRINDKASVAFVSDCAALYLEPNSRWGGFDANTIGAYYFVQQLAMPVLLVNESNGKFTCYISQVDNADYYILTYADGESVNVPKSEGLNTAYVLPDKDPGKYSLKVVAASVNGEQFKASAPASTTVEVYITLKMPEIVACGPVMKEDGEHVILKIKHVAHALKYEITIEGQTYVRNVPASGELEEDITDKVSGVGVYTIYVKATAPGTNYKTSSSALLSYVHTKKLEMEIAENRENGLTLTWNAVKGAYAYSVRLYNGEQEVAALVLNESATSVSITDAEGNVNANFGEVEHFDAYAVVPLGTGFYKNGNLEKHSYAPEE